MSNRLAGFDGIEPIKAQVASLPLCSYYKTKSHNAGGSKRSFRDVPSANGLKQHFSSLKAL